MTGDKQIVCSRCGLTAYFSAGLVGWFLLPKGADSSDVLCHSCGSGVENTVSLDGARLVDTSAPGTPIAGNFRPVRQGEDLTTFVNTVPFGSLWFGIERAIESDIQEKGKGSYRILFVYEDYPSMEFRFSTEGSGHTVLMVPIRDEISDRDLDVYQHYRLRRMGFRQEEERSPYSISLSPDESTPRNIGRIIAHLGLFIYDLNPAWIAKVAVKAL